MTLQRRLILILLLLTFGASWWAHAQSTRVKQPGPSQESDWINADSANPSRLRGETRAPEFPPGADWLNVSRPLTLRDLKGKVVLLDFWTFCCINCMHVIPDLKRLEAKYPDSLVVVGVHSAKFTVEKDTQNIRDAVLRYGVEHPVINDSSFKLWNAYGIQGWPSFALLDPTGRIVGITSGEGVYDSLNPLIGEMVAYYKREMALDPKPLPFLRPEHSQKPRSLLSYPGKVAVDEMGRRLFLSDSNHDRILVLSPEGAVLEVIGRGTPGFLDGTYGTAAFSHPQGLVYDSVRGMLYVADTENHAIRRVDLRSRKVETLAGTGHQAQTGGAGGPVKTTALNSPWDLTQVGNQLYIAMAGAHQIWKLDLVGGRIGVFAGSGREGLTDGFLPDADLAQTSGIVSEGHKLYFVDSESSSVRMADLDPSGRADTLVGSGLFDFGDVDGEKGTVRLQHPIGLALHDGKLFVADTYNNKIKVLDPKTRKVTAWLGSGKAGWADGAGPTAMFDEPCGLVFGWGRWYIADTNNHALRVADPATSRVTTLQLKGLDKLVQPVPRVNPESKVPELPKVAVAPGEGQVELTIALPTGMEINPQAPSVINLESGNQAVASVPKAGVAVKSTLVRVPLTLHRGITQITAHLTLYYCSEGKVALCYFYQGDLTLPIRVTPGATGKLKFPFNPRTSTKP